MADSDPLGDIWEQYHRLGGLLDIAHTADCLDVRGCDIREWLKSDPGRLPKPLWLDGRFPKWPFDQLRAWIRAGMPRDFEHEAGEFVPTAIAWAYQTEETSVNEEQNGPDEEATEAGGGAASGTSRAG